MALYDALELFGLEFTTDEFQINPAFPMNYHFDSPDRPEKRKQNLKRQIPTHQSRLLEKLLFRG